MRHSLKGLCGAGALVLPLSVMVPAILSPALAQQPVVRDLSGGNSFYDQTATQAQASGNLALFNQVEQHQRELRELRGQIEELRYQLDQLKQQSRQQYMDLDQRMSELPRQAAPPSAPS
ncbi:MAG TPA: tol-pal system protein YbgF, partial [Cobetia sp.]|nr:tol-pal system protein YbgF [Cobetia sp.]